MKLILSAAAGAATGVLSAWGVGGGTLLIIYMTALAGVGQQEAQGINLLYFIPTSLASLFFHCKNKLVNRKIVIPAIIAGAPAAVLTSFVSSGADSDVVRYIFGVFLIIVGISELFFKKGEKEDSDM